MNGELENIYVVLQPINNNNNWESILGKETIEKYIIVTITFIYYPLFEQS
jgi:hypothetical protein